MSRLYRTNTLGFTFLPGAEVPGGYTQRMLPVASNTSSRSLQTYMSSVDLVMFDGMALHTLSDAAPRMENKGTQYFQAFHAYTTSLSSPDGDLPYKKGDYFVPTNSDVGLVCNTAHMIGGVQQFPTYWELILQRPL